MNPTLQWKPISPVDAPEVKRISGLAHASLPEREEVFAEKIGLFPSGCAQLVGNGRCVGYSLSHPWQHKAVPPVDAFLTRIPPQPDCLHLHDIVVLPEARGLGASEDFMRRSRELARELRLAHLALVAVYGTDAVWSRFGFTTCTEPGVVAQLTTYGPTARYMTCPLD